MNIKEWTIGLGTLLMLAACTDATSPKTSANQVAPAASMQASGPDASAVAENKAEVEPAPSARAATTVAQGAELQGSSEKPASKYLPSEQRLLRQGGLALESVMPILASPNFDKSVNSLARDAANDPEAQQLSRLYANEAMQSLDKRGQLTGLSCGLSVCMGAVRMASKEAASEWSNAFADRKSAPSYSFVSDIRQIGANQYEARFVFSTDPTTNSLTGVVMPGKR